MPEPLETDELLRRYSEEERETVRQYWETIRWTRRHGRISDRIKATELDYWRKFDADVVIAALAVHIEQYSKLRENYTRGIIRNKAAEKAQNGAVKTVLKERKQAPQYKNRFINFEQRDDWDFDAIEKKAQKKLDELTEAPTEKLLADPIYARRYAKINGYT